MFLGLHVKCQIFLLDFNQIWPLLMDFHESPNIEFYENSTRASRDEKCGETDGQTDGQE
jgi:hypothetical protein